MRHTAFQEITGNGYFWLYYLSVCFPLAFDEASEMTLADFIYEGYDCDGDAAVWVDEFVQYSEETMQAHDGHAPNPTTVVIPAGADEYAVQFHPGDTIFFRNGQKLGSTGPHYELHRIPFASFAELYRQIGFVSALLLPMVSVGDSERQQASVLILTLLQQMQLQDADLELVTNMILEGLKP